MTTHETPASFNTETIRHDSNEPLPRVVAAQDIAFVVDAGYGEIAIGDDAVLGLASGRRIEVNQGTQYQLLWGDGLVVTIVPQSV
jgi:hypothetical protein